MAIDIQSAENVQQIEFEVKGPGDVNRVFILTGELQMHIYDQSNHEVKETIRHKLTPEFTEDEFERAIAIVSPISVANIINPTQTQTFVSMCLIEGADADRDDETGKVELRVEAIIKNSNLRRLAYQVIVLAKM